MGPLPETSIRRFVTILRSDVQGSTSLGERHDPELIRRVLARYYDAARAACTHHGGRIEQIQGDAVVAVFEGHEDDALRAVRAATELRDRMARLNEELERDTGMRLLIRTGVDSGEVVSGPDGPGQLAGDVMNVVAHLERTAGPGEIVLGEASLRLVREAVDVQQLGPLDLKGKEEPVRAYRLLVVLPGVTRRAHLAVPMVGRETELAVLVSAYERTATSRTCHLVTLLGAAGVGKSRLVEELLRSVRQRATVLRGRCPPYGGVAYDAMIQVITEAADLDLSDPGTALDRLAAAVTGVEGANRIAERVGQVLGLRKGAGPPEDTHWALRRLLEALARERPLIVVLEDLHWGDPALLDLIEDISESAREASLLLICAARLELLDARRRWAGGKVNAISIQLSALDADQAGQLVSHLLGGVATAPGVQEYIVDRSGGNPLFVQGLVTMLREERLLRVDAEHWRVAVEELEVPRDIQAMVAVRLDQLEEIDRGVLERAAIVGQRFTVEAIARLMPAMDRSAVTASLRMLVRKELVVPDPDSAAGPAGPDQGYAFAHALIQEVAYSAIAKEARAELHERFAGWLGETSGRAQVDELVGRHLELAYRNLVEVGRNDERTRGLARRAGEALAAAGHRAATRRDIPESAASLLWRAESLLHQNDETRRALLLDLGDALGAFDPKDALEVYGRARDEAKAAGDRRRAMHAILGAGEVRRIIGLEGAGAGEQADIVEDAIRLFDEIGDDLGLARAWRTKAHAHWVAGQMTEAERASRQAIEFARHAGDEPLEAATVSAHCFILFWGPKHVDEVARYVKQALEWTRSRGIRSLEAHALLILARIAAMQGDFPTARAYLWEANKLDAQGDLLVLVGEHVSAGIVELLADVPAAAEGALRLGYQGVVRLPGTGQLVPLMILLARALTMQGRDGEAMERTVECERAALESQLDAQIKWRAIRALLLARRREFEVAERLAAEAVELTAKSEQIDSTAEVLADQGHVLRLANKEIEAQRQAEHAFALFERKGNLVGARRMRAFLEKSPS